MRRISELLAAHGCEPAPTDQCAAIEADLTEAQSMRAIGPCTAPFSNAPFRIWSP